MKKTIIFLLFLFLALSVFISSPVLAAKCSDEKPDHPPDLFQIDVTKNSATLYFTPVNNAVTNYWIAYGLARGEDRYGVSYPSGRYDGVINYTVNNLALNTRYYFRVKAVNGCRQGFWSDSMSVKTNWESKTYTRFKEEPIGSNNSTLTFGKNALKEITPLSKLTPQPSLQPSPQPSPTTTVIITNSQVKGTSTKNFSKYIFPVILLILLILLVLSFYKKRKNNSS